MSARSACTSVALQDLQPTSAGPGICDVFDALVSPRPCKRASTENEAVAELIAQRGRQFDPALVGAFVRLLPDVRDDLAALSPRAALAADPLTARVT